MINERMLKLLCLIQIVKTGFGKLNPDKATYVCRGKTYDFKKMTEDITSYWEEVLSEYEINVDENAEKSE